MAARMALLLVITQLALVGIQETENGPSEVGILALRK